MRVPNAGLGGCTAGAADVSFAASPDPFAPASAIELGYPYDFIKNVDGAW